MKTTLAEHFDKLMQQTYCNGQPGAALLIASEGEVLYERGFGVADMASAMPITPTTNFRLASVSKQFTAMAIQLLVQQRLLNYEDRLDRFFSGFRMTGKPITLRHLLTHTSGLPDYEGLVDDNRQDQVSDDEVLRLISSQGSNLFEPGSQFYYSNTGFVLLALVVQQVACMPYAVFLKQYIFEPLGMSGSRLYEAGLEIPERAMGYASDAAGETIFSDQSICTATKGDGCIYTSVQDYFKWHEALEQNSAFMIERVLQEVNATIPGSPGWHYGMGWFFARRKNGSFEMYHTGNTCGFSNLVIRIPENNSLVACLSNIADNPHLLTGLLDALQPYPKLRPESGLVRQLLNLTR
ncbi:serine hydrolase domain-containing protein [Pontibacter sp. MBLB2868]|uniref:serine hydrolase domain-containing protein n=1 Tax=Pontibacter sp. MBLB2868 TaxID=3451555 RepID=UPI003F74BCC8